MSLLCRFMSLICRFYVTFMSLSNFITFWNIIKYIQFMSYVTRFWNFPQTLYWFSMVFKWKLNNFLTVFCQYFMILLKIYIFEAIIMNVSTVTAKQLICRSASIETILFILRRIVSGTGYMTHWQSLSLLNPIQRQLFFWCFSLQRAKLRKIYLKSIFFRLYFWIRLELLLTLRVIRVFNLNSLRKDRVLTK